MHTNRTKKEEMKSRTTDEKVEPSGNKCDDHLCEIYCTKSVVLCAVARK